MYYINGVGRRILLSCNFFILYHYIDILTYNIHINKYMTKPPCEWCIIFLYVAVPHFDKSTDVKHFGLFKLFTVTNDSAKNILLYII